MSAVWINARTPYATSARVERHGFGECMFERTVVARDAGEAKRVAYELATSVGYRVLTYPIATAWPT